MKGWRSKREPVLVSREITISNELGMHARPAAEFARKAGSFRSDVTLIKDGQRFSATSVIDILRANLERGATATLEANGHDAPEAVEALARLLGELRD
ncbi:MAG: HPr family phosphocarrier protein [Chthoniobacterales bacterium]|nr:HPr family phosphocarrier protein [Chthoniobacterales bacterium]